MASKLKKTRIRKETEPLVYERAIGTGPVEEPVPIETTAELLHWFERLNQGNIRIKKDPRLHKK